MTIYDISPAFIVLSYRSNGHPHKQVIPVSFFHDTVPTPGSDPVDCQLHCQAGVVTFEDFISGLILVYAPVFKTTAAFLFAELYSKPTPDDDPLFISIRELGVAGTSSSAESPYCRATYSLRSVSGGKASCVLMEGIFLTNVDDPAPIAAGDRADISDFIKDVNSAWKARDGGYIVACSRFLTKVDNVLRKRYVLNA